MMTGLSVSHHTAPFKVGHSVSSAYLVMLNRHLDYLLRQSNSKEAGPLPIQFDPSLENVIEIDRISPILKQIEKLTGHCGFGLEIGKYMHPSDYGIFGYAMMNCNDLLSALKTASEHKTILNQKLFAEFIPDQEHIIYQVNTDVSSKEIKILIELDFSTALEFARKLAGPSFSHAIQLTSVHFTHEPLGPVALYEERFNCPVHFGDSANRIRISKAVLETPIYGANPKVLSALEDKIVKISSHEQHASVRLSQQVANYVRKNMRWDLPSGQQTAKAFNMSLSAFKKRLNAEHTCYQNICDEVRYKRCIDLIKQGNVAIKEISYELGFANASAFNRAFKRWTGQNPSEFKKSTNQMAPS